ncbi:hypothetical protein PFWH6_2910 [Pseudomonas fluorescens WH6]|nr:hypothetical protein PFWH6_2910 [Pseudomonas fluorescens WH6]
MQQPYISTTFFHGTVATNSQQMTVNHFDGPNLKIWLPNDALFQVA